MVHRGVIVAVLFSVLAIPIDAGVTYRFTRKSTAALQSTSGGRVWIDGDRKRIKLDPDPTNPRTHDVTIIADGKTTFINLQNRTYFNEQKKPPQAIRTGTSSLFHLPWASDGIQGRPKISYRAAGAGPLLGEHATTKHLIQFSYRLKGEMEGTPLKGEVEATVTVATAPALAAGDDRSFVRTGFHEIDDELIRMLSAMEGMVVSYEISVGRKLEGGPMITQTTTSFIDEWKTIDVDASLFTVPADLVFQQPVYGFPGAETVR
ncbi:MAG TPA: hypothetical protein VGQ76_03455 [Thermoanaerobaculia bacterium]|jgi:hypothetical protein|nr:hypothetical protein [Thermoanaerobaculia bacterium]